MRAPRRRSKWTPPEYPYLQPALYFENKFIQASSRVCSEKRETKTGKKDETKKFKNSAQELYNFFKLIHSERGRRSVHGFCCQRATFMHLCIFTKRQRTGSSVRYLFLFPPVEVRRATFSPLPSAKRLHRLVFARKSRRFSKTHLRRTL